MEIRKEEKIFIEGLKRSIKDKLLVDKIIEDIHKIYFDPSNSVAFIYSTRLVKNLEKRKNIELTESERLEILERFWFRKHHNLELDLLEEIFDEFKKGSENYTT